MTRPPVEYHSIAVRVDSQVYEYLTMVKETHLLKSYTEAVVYIITMLDPDWDLAMKLDK